MNAQQDIPTGTGDERSEEACSQQRLVRRFTHRNTTGIEIGMAGGGRLRIGIFFGHIPDLVFWGTKAKCYWWAREGWQLRLWRVGAAYWPAEAPNARMSGDAK